MLTTSQTVAATLELVTIRVGGEHWMLAADSYRLLILEHRDSDGRSATNNFRLAQRLGSR